MKKLTKLLFFTIVAVTVFSITGCGSSISDTSSGDVQEESNEKEYDMSDEVKIGNMEIVVSNVMEDDHIGGDDQIWGEAQTRGKFVSVSMIITNLGDSEIRVDSSEFKLIADGKTYSPSVDPAVVEAFGGSFLFYKSINPNMDMLGMVAFEVPVDLTDYSLLITPSGTDEKAIIHLNTN